MLAGHFLVAPLLHRFLPAPFVAAILPTLGIFLLPQKVIWAHCYGRQGLGRVQGAAVMIGISASALDL